MSIKIIFMGTPDFAVPALSALIESEYDLVAVITQPDRPKGRGKKLAPPPVKVVAEAAGVSVLQPESLKTEAAKAALIELAPDLIVVAAFGQILQKEVLDLPPHGCLNIHASLLPRWRGASPVTAAIRAGDAQSGVTLMQMDVGLDTGPMLAKQSISIRPDHTGATLTTELADVGATLLLDTLPDWLAGKIIPQPQDNALATLAPRLKKGEGRIDWSEPASAIERQVRAFDPWPGTFTEGARGPFKVLAIELTPDVLPPPHAEPGTIFKHKKQVHVITGEGPIRLVTVQPGGKKAMSAQAMLNGQPDLWDTQLGTP